MRAFYPLHRLGPGAGTQRPAGGTVAGLASGVAGPYSVCMQLHDPPPPEDTPAQRRRDRDRLMAALRFGVGFASVLAFIYVLQDAFDWRHFTVAPWSVAGLMGLLTAPLLHGSAEHVLANGTAVILLGALSMLVYPRATWRALPLLWIGSGLGAWLLGEPGSHHLGASGVTHGLMFLVFVLGLLRRDRASVAAAMIGFLFYGGMLLTVLPQEPGVSWQSHLGGAIAGVVAAWLFRRVDPVAPRKLYSWELEDAAADDAGDMLEPARPHDVPVLWQRREGERGTVLQFPPRDPARDPSRDPSRH